MAELDLPLLALPVGSTKRKVAADTIYNCKLQRRSELDADRVASAASALQSNLDRLREQPATGLVDGERWDNALEQVLNDAVRRGLEPIQVWWMCKSIIEQRGGNNERRARVANVVDGWYAAGVLRSNLTRLLEQPAAWLVDGERWRWENALEQVLDDAVRRGLEPIQVWEVCKSIIETWRGNDERRNRAAEVSVDWYAKYVE
jgi:hypothetical protein